MTFINSNANLKQFQLLKFVNDNCSDEHVISKISIVLRRDKIEAPYYMDTKIRMSTCIDNSENGVIHAMDLLNHNRMHNLTKEKYDQIKSLIADVCNKNQESDQFKIFKGDKRLKIILTSKNDEEFKKLYNDYHELFEKIDNLVD